MVEFNFVLDHLATGSGITTTGDVDALVAAGVTHILNCRDEFDDAPLLAGRALTYCWNGAPDDGQPKPTDWFAKSIAFAVPALAAFPGTAQNARPRVFAHCAGGLNRGPSTTYAIMLALGFPYDTAEQLIRKVRPQVLLAYKADAVKAISVLGY